MLKLNLQYFGHLMQRADSLEKTLMLEKTEVRRRKRQQRTGLQGSVSSLALALALFFRIYLLAKL